MRRMIVYFIALFAIPVIQVAIGPRYERTGAPVLIDRSSEIILAVSKHLRTRDVDSPLNPKSERRPKAS